MPARKKPAVEKPKPARIAARGLQPTTSLAAASVAWLEHLRRSGLSGNTIKNYRIDVQLLAGHYGAGTALNQFTTKSLNAFIKWLQSGRSVPCAPKSLDRRITALKSFFRWAALNAGLKSDPADAVINVSVRSPLPALLSDAEVDLALGAAESFGERKLKPDPRPFALLTLVLHTGLRKGEVARLEHRHLDFANRKAPALYVRYADKRHRHKERKVDVDPDWLGIYEDYVARTKKNPRVFPYSVRLLEYWLEDTTNHAALAQRITFDRLRWKCAVTDYLADMEPDLLRRKLGVSKVQWSEVRRRIVQLAGK